MELILSRPSVYIFNFLLMIKLCIVLLITVCLQTTSANSFSQTISLSFKAAKLETVLKEISYQTGYNFVYLTPAINKAKPVSISVKNATLEQVLEKSFSDQPLTYKINSNTIIVENKAKAFMNPLLDRNMFEVVPPWDVSGKVTDSQGEPLIGVSVKVLGSSVGVSTDINGRYTILVPEDATVLVFTYIGFNEKRIPITNRTTIDVQLDQNNQALEEVVVVAYGTQKKSDLTGAVSSIKGAVIEGQAITNVNQAMQGRAAGVHIVSSSGEPGSPLQVRVRGMGSFGDNTPLYVIDGVFVKENELNILNPNDILSIEVLKDASAAAMYGARAGNGVVLITTASGGQGRTELRYNGYFGVQSFDDFIPVLNSQQYADLNNEANISRGSPLEAWANNSAVLAVNTNWQKEAFQTAPMQNHSLSASGGDKDKSFLVSGEYLDQEGVFVSSYMKRYSGRINTRFKIGEKLTMGESLTISRIEGLNRGQGSDLDFSYMFGASPTIPLYDDRNLGGYGGPAASYAGDNNRDNIVGRRAQRRNFSNSTRLLGNAFGELLILPYLKFRVNLGLNAGLATSTAFTPIFEMNNRTNRIATLNESKNESSEILFENLLTYDKTFNDAFEVSLLGGYTQQSAIYKSMSGSIREFPSNDQPVLSAGTGLKNVGGNTTDWALRSFLGRANFTAYNKYLLSATFRRDGSSRFGSKNRYGNFPSIAAGWIISRENFMQGLPISFLKLRGSWGQLGNQEIGNYVSLAVVNTNQPYVFGRNRAIAVGGAVTAMGNPFLKWETTTQSNIGFDVGLLADKVRFEIDYYRKDTEDLLLRVPVSSVSGVARDNGPFQNAGGVSNNGFDFMLTYNDRLPNLNFGISMNLSTVNNKVTSMGGESSIISLVDNSYFYGTYTYSQEGLPMSNFYGHIYDGIFQNISEVSAHASQPGAVPGDIRFKDINNDGIVDANDRTIIGSPLPDFTYGFNGNASYKNLDFSFGFVGVQGIKLYNANRAYLESMLGDMNQSIAVLGRWKGEGTSTDMPRVTRTDPNRNTRPSTRYVEDASFLRLQNLQIGYKLPSALIEKFGLQTFRIYGNAQNLFTLTKYTGYNPEVVGDTPGISSGGLGFASPLAIGVDSGTYPLARVVQLGVDIRF